MKLGSTWLENFWISCQINFDPHNYVLGLRELLIHKLLAFQAVGPEFHPRIHDF